MFSISPIEPLPWGNSHPVNRQVLIQNSAHFMEKIGYALTNSNQMVSQDVVNLFTKVPIDETITVARDKLATDPSLEEITGIPVDNLMEMLTFCVKTTYLSPVLAHVYMEYFEEMALKSTSLNPSM